MRYRTGPQLEIAPSRWKKYLKKILAFEVIVQPLSYSYTQIKSFESSSKGFREKNMFDKCFLITQFF